MNVRTTSLAALCALVLPACSGGGSTGGVGPGGKFLVLATQPLNNGRLFLNEPIRIDFTTPVDLSSADLNTISFQVLDQNGNPLTEQPAGRFALDRSPSDTAVGRRLLFIPRFPTNNTFDNGGFRPGRTYLVQLVGGDRITQTSLRDVNGKALAAPITFRFATEDGTTPAQLFRDTKPGGPMRVDFQISPPPDAQGVVLNKFGAPSVELRLVFNQPLNPNSNNVPVALDTNPLLRSINQRGRIFLEYDDSVLGNAVWIPADVDLEVNDLDRSVVLVRPVGVLPNNADVRVIVENTLEDMSGESNVANLAYSRSFGAFRTRSAYEPQFDAVVENFIESSQIDSEAPFLEPQADFNRGFLEASFAFEGTTTTLEYEPNSQEVVLNTDFTQIVPRVGTPFNVSGGVFNFRNVTIPQGVRVTGLGTRPMVWLVSNDFRISGLLSVRGGNGARVDVLNSANFPTAAGIGVCGGGNGGRGSPNSTARSPQGEPGFGPGQRPAGGGGGGNIACQAGCNRGAGGGGGSLATQGDPWYKSQAGAGTNFQQQRGVGGQGCLGAAGAASRILAGGVAGPSAFSDSRADNNFWGVGINVQRQLRIVGELVQPIGGAGGGGGGDRSNSGGCDLNSPNFIGDSKGGGGGGGGGVLIVKALRDIIIESTGRIVADGGHGGGGEQAGSCNEGGGGGGGSGGIVILMAGREIVIHAKGTGTRFTYAQNDYDFSVSADGGLTLTGTFGSPVVSAKYPSSGGTVMPGATYDGAPLGALGGMGIVQLMAPSGDPASTTSNPDMTNTVLDDNIKVFRNGAPLTGTEKRQMLAWRGFPNAQGVLVGDFGVPTNIGSDEGDIRPSPTLLPVPYNTRTRARSKWIDTGSSVRRPLTSADGNPRGIVENTVSGFLTGPTYDWAGTTPTPGATNEGYAAYQQTGGESVRLDFPAVLPSAVPVLRAEAGVSYLGQPAYRVELTGPSLGAIVDRYLGYEAELMGPQGTNVGSYRILTHTDRVLLLSVESGVLASNVASLQIRAKFFDIAVDGAEGLGPTYTGSSNNPVPRANVRIGFAFHRNPRGANPADRFPTDPNDWVFDLSDPLVQEEIRSRGMRYMMWDVMFDSAFKSVPTDNPPGLSPSSPRPSLNFLRTPFRF